MEECKCDMRTKLVGSGCMACNPEYWEEMCDWKVTADHPILARPDKFGMSKAEARAYADSLQPLGYENISITIDA